ncbi:unnamed protein product [Lepeophtheirus salmonis]|uniref:(salmon louse) hypothetical protein n=1 Tax=Lepeophtheirus salmonis TaxID=72036 RepID=A0A7R8H3U6_LEPSM|nr:unnamed protein product [Lepeophtheirus salmonis]CAF2847927.1 unnamed protein product [Lepeophtheirus salmonis]
MHPKSANFLPDGSPYSYSRSQKKSRPLRGVQRQQKGHGPSTDLSLCCLRDIDWLCSSVARKEEYRRDKRRVPKVGQCRSGFDCGYGKICNRTEFCVSISCDSDAFYFCENDSDCPPMYGCFYTGYCRPFYGVCPRELDCDCKSSSLMCYNRNCYCKDEGLSSRCLRHCLKNKDCDSKCEKCHHHRCILRDPDSKECFQKPICSTIGPKCCSDGDCSQKCLGTYCCDNSCKHQKEFTLPERCSCSTDEDCHGLGDGFECHRCVAVPEYDGKKVCGVVDPKCCHGKPNSCAKDEVCTHGTCVQLKCSSNSTCPTCYHAHGSDGICGNAALMEDAFQDQVVLSHEECYRGQHCNKGRCIPSTYCCEKEEDCPQGNQQCNTDCKICHICKESKGGFKSCVKAKQCCNYGSCKNEKYICDNGACIESQICSSTSACPSCYICHHDEQGIGRCVKANKCCSDDHGCSSYARCHGGACVVEAGFNSRTLNCLKPTKCECPTPNLDYGIQVKKEEKNQTCDPGKSKDFIGSHGGGGDRSADDSIEKSNSPEDSGNIHNSNESDASNEYTSSTGIQHHTKQLSIHSTSSEYTDEHSTYRDSEEYEYSDTKEHLSLKYDDDYTGKDTFEYSEEDSSIEKDDFWADKPKSQISKPYSFPHKTNNYREYKDNGIGDPYSDYKSNIGKLNDNGTLDNSQEYLSNRIDEKNPENQRKKIREYNFNHKFKSDGHHLSKEEDKKSSEKKHLQNVHDSYNISNVKQDIGTFTDYGNKSDRVNDSDSNIPKENVEKPRNLVASMVNTSESNNLSVDQNIRESIEDRGRFDPYHHEKMDVKNSFSERHRDDEEVVTKATTTSLKKEKSFEGNELDYREDVIPGIKIGQLKDSNEESLETRAKSEESLEDFITYENDNPRSSEKNNPTFSNKKTPGVLMIKLKDTRDISNVVIDQNRTDISGEEKFDSVKIPKILRKLNLESSQRKEVWQDPEETREREIVITDSKRGLQPIAVIETPTHEIEKSITTQTNDPISYDQEKILKEYSNYARLDEQNSQLSSESVIEDPNHATNYPLSHRIKNFLKHEKEPIKVNINQEKRPIVSPSSPRKALFTPMQNTVNVHIERSTQKVQQGIKPSTIQQKNSHNRGLNLIKVPQDTSLICFRKSSLYRERCRKIFCSSVEDCPPCSNCVSRLCQPRENCCLIHEDCLTNQFCSHAHQTCVDCSKIHKEHQERCLK